MENKILMKKINKPKISRWIGGSYIILTIFISILCIAMMFGTDISSHLYLQIFFFSMITFILLLLGITIYGFYKTVYVIQDGFLYSWSPFATIKLKINDIKKVERTLVPFHFRFGASLYSGRFYIPSLGWTKAIITNLSDGVLITTKDKKHYLVTPSNPDRFVKLLEPNK